MTGNEPNSPSAAEAAPDEAVRAISNVETLRALADPTRLKLLSALMQGPASAMPVMSVKELAARIGEPQTKLYRHMKQLEAAGLIRVAASRVVSGIVEQRYQACQRDLMFGPGLTESERGSAGLEAAVAAGLELYRSQFFSAQRAGLIGSASEDRPADESHHAAILSIGEAQMPKTHAASIRERLKEIIEDVDKYSREDHDPGADGDSDQVTTHVLIGYFCPRTPDE
ncbi:MAG TPA: metalloregulator ArsR/SmtB family transcription factor [Streptosporangiaceae bacterium]|nr:metalloregulator ArsR/SmtB family transcription factor [Streptosporangiaceae bacterium]